MSATPPGPSIQFRILGPLDVACDDRSPRLGGARQRAVLAALLLHRDQVVSAERLIEMVWGPAPPNTARPALQGHIAQLRRRLGAELIQTTGPGYRLPATAGTLDAEQFAHEVGAARAAIAGGEAADGSRRLQDALALWRGAPLSDVELEGAAACELERLEELRLVALEARIEADLALGRHAVAVPELRVLVARHPLREPLHALLMLALYRSGRQADALAAYRDARGALIDAAGLEPGPGLRELERAVLAQDPALERGAGDPPPPIAADASEASASPTPLIGREPELQELLDLLARSDVRLVTVTGTGGCGKTALARAALSRLAEGDGDAVAVALDDIGAGEVFAAVARALAIADATLDGLCAGLRDRRVLLLLDTFEHVSAAGPVLLRLLTRAAGVTLLVTSRSRLRISGEHELALAPLALPAPGHATDVDAVNASPAGSLFSARAAAACPGFAVDERNAVEVAEICRRAEGLPLALELAASQLRLLSVRQLLERLQTPLAVLRSSDSGAAERHRTLRASLDWSDAQLDPVARGVLRRLAVFGGDFTLESALEVLVPRGGEEHELLDGIASLLDHSLLTRRRLSDGEVRFRLLDTTRAYAREQLAADAQLQPLGRGRALHVAATPPVLAAVAPAGDRRLARRPAC